MKWAEARLRLARVTRMERGMVSDGVVVVSGSVSVCSVRERTRIVGERKVV